MASFTPPIGRFIPLTLRDGAEVAFPTMAFLFLELSTLGFRRGEALLALALGFHVDLGPAGEDPRGEAPAKREFAADDATIRANSLLGDFTPPRGFPPTALPPLPREGSQTAEP